MNKPRPYAEASAAMADGMARICRLYGMSPLVGRLYTALLLSPEPLSLEDLAEGAGAAKSTVSVALRKLLSARVAVRLPPRLDRRDFYRAVDDPWTIFADWTTHFFRPELQMFEQTGAKLSQALSAPDGPVGAEAKVVRARLAAFEEFSQVVLTMLSAVEQRRPESKPARRIPISGDGE